MTSADIANAAWGVLLLVMGFSILRRRRPIGRWDYRPFGAFAIFIGALGVAFAVAAFVAAAS